MFDNLFNIYSASEAPCETDKDMMESEGSRFLIFCADKEDVSRIKTDLGMQPGCVVETSDNSQMAALKISSGEVTCLIFNCHLFNLGSLNSVGVLRSGQPRTPVIVIAESVDKEVLAYNRKLQHIVLIERKHYNHGVMFDLCTRVRQGKPVYRRAHERFITSQTVVIERLTDRTAYDGVMRNMSRGGAFLDVDGILQDGDILKVTVTLTQVNKAHVVCGEVVRLIIEGYPKGKCGAGIRYISPQDLYSALLEKI